LLLPEVHLGICQRLNRGVLTVLGALDRLIGLLLGQPDRGILVDHFGTSLAQIRHNLLRAQGKRLTGGGRRDDVLGCTRHHQSSRRAVDVRGGGKGVEPPLGVADGGGGTFYRPVAGVHLELSGGSGITGFLDLNDCLIDTFLFDLDAGPDLLEALVCLGDIGDERRKRVGLRLRLCLRQAGNGQRDREAQGQRGHSARRLADRSRERTAKGCAHARSHSTLTPQFHCQSQL